MITAKNILRKWYIILIFAVLGASALYFEKGVLHPGVPQSGDMFFSRVVQFEEVPVFISRESGQEIDITKSANVWGNLSDFSSTLASDFQIKQINRNWGSLKDAEKIKWVGKHFKVSNIGPGTYELIMQFSKSDPKNQKYIMDHSAELMNAYAQYVQGTASALTPNTQLKTLKDYQAIDKTVTTQDAVLKKYVISGFVLGALVGFAIVLVFLKRAERRRN